MARIPKDELLDELVARYPALSVCREAVGASAEAVIASLAGGGCLYVCGNGGSAADAEHIVGEFLKRFMLPRPLPAELTGELVRRYGPEGEYLARHLEQGLRAIALTSHPSLATAMANDVAADLVFAQQLLALGRPGDVLLAISTSGNAANVCHALRVARAMGVVTLGLTGSNKGEMNPLCDRLIEAPAHRTHEIQELHLPIYHLLCRVVEQHFFPPQSAADSGVA